MTEPRGGRRSARRTELALTVPRGGENDTVDELRALGLQSELHTEPGRVRLRRASDREFALVVNGARTVERVWMLAASGRTESFAELEMFARRIEWDRWLGPADHLHVHVACRRSRLRHTRGIADRLYAAAGAPEGAGRDPADRTQAVRLVIESDRARLFVDATGAPIAERGWRTEPGPAPLNPAVAALALRRSGWRPGGALLDPMCGSGTILIEAARMATGRTVVADARSGHWPSLNTGAWASAVGEVAASAFPGGPPLRGVDISEAAIRRTLANARRAGVGEAIEASTADVAAVKAADGFVVTNPPWGHRLDGLPPGVRDSLAQLMSNCVGAACIWPAQGRGRPPVGEGVSPLVTVLHRGTRLAVYATPGRADPPT